MSLISFPPEQLYYQPLLASDHVLSDTDNSILFSLVNEPVNTYVNVPYPTHPDDYAVLRFGNAMRQKMDLSREKGRYGWDNPALCSSEYLAALLYSHVEKGDVVDIANFCMMLHERGVTNLNDLPSLIDDCE
jgi:hypothetical protein